VASDLGLAGSAETIGSLSGEGTVILGAGGALTVNSELANPTPFSGTITGDGSLTKIGPGKLILAGRNDYTGGTTVLDGTLEVTSPDALVAGYSLTIEAGATVVLSSGLSVAGASAHAATPVPEHSTLARLGIGAVGLLACVWRRRKRAGQAGNGA
jgi:autotransporter-associated beta strand protein